MSETVNEVPVEETPPPELIPQVEVNLAPVQESPQQDHEEVQPLLEEEVLQGEDEVPHEDQPANLDESTPANCPPTANHMSANQPANVAAHNADALTTSSDEGDVDEEDGHLIEEQGYDSLVANANRQNMRNASGHKAAGRNVSSDYTARFYRMTPHGIGDDDEGDGEEVHIPLEDHLILGESAATDARPKTIHRLQISRNESTEESNEIVDDEESDDGSPPRIANNVRPPLQIGACSSRGKHTQSNSRQKQSSTTSSRYTVGKMSPKKTSRHQLQMTASTSGQSTSNTVPNATVQPMVHNVAAVVRGHRAPAVSFGWQATKATLKERMSFMFCNEILADVHFLVGRADQRQRVAAHKFVLSTGSAVFDAMFNGQLGAHSDDNDIELPDVEPQAFLALLNFLYSDDVNIGPETVMTTLYTAKKYAVPALETACVEFLKKHLTADNACMLLTQARLFDESHLATMCLEVIDRDTGDALAADGFTDIDLDTLCAILERDTLRVREVLLFKAVCRWSASECGRLHLTVTADHQRDVLARALSLIRFPLMSVEEFAQSVAQTGMLHDREALTLFLYFTVNPKPNTGFLDVPRCCMTGKEQTINRFQRIEGRWGYSGTPDRIKFTVDRRIYLVGFGLYGSIHGPTDYATTIQLVHCGTGKTLAVNDTQFSCDGSASTFRVLFKEPIEVTPSVTYIASACMKGPDSHYGTKGLRRIVHQSPTYGCVSFQFTYAAGNNNGTSVEDGQIPEIIFYTKL